MRPKLLCQLTLFLILLIAAAPAEARRVALIIGNNNYSALSKLDNPVPDAKAVAGVLKAHGFEVFEHYDITRADLLDALETFKKAADQSSAALIYYAGHGMALAGKNVIAPIDMEVNCDNQEALRSVEADKLFEALGSAPQQVVLLDACRDNPFPKCAKRSAGGTGTGFRGLSRVGDPDKSRIIANATALGDLAGDGLPGNHSPFAKALLARFQASPKQFMRDLLDDTSRDVKVATNNSQVPDVLTQGGAPAICLDEEGCGGAGPVVGPGPVSEATVSEVGTLLRERGYSVGTGKPSDPAFADAIRKYEATISLPQDGQASATLLAVLHATAKLEPNQLTVPHGPLEHQIGEIFKDCENCPDMVAVQAGSYMMGAAPSETGHMPAELPQHHVQIGHAFAASKYDITFDDWDACALEGGCNGYMPKDGGWGRGKRPAIFVSWDDAKAYIDWLRQKTGKQYRLLSEAEWEFAARAGTTTPYTTGATITTAQADFDASASGGKPGDYAGKTAEVGSFPPNPFGLYDMAGNVWEWVEDCWNPTHAGAPADGSARGGDCTRRVLKGGAWYFEAAYLRAASRLSYPKTSRLNVVGFRVGRSLE
jgi:formylglycine-generating enzyme required for sulfatase activity